MIFQKAKQDIYFGAKEGEFLISNFLNVYCSKKKVAANYQYLILLHIKNESWVWFICGVIKQNETTKTTS
jgi:hypothetical protein